MLGFESEKPVRIHTTKKIDVFRLKGEINALAGELKFLKGRIRDPELNLAMYRWACGKTSFNDATKEFSAAQMRRWKTKRRFNKLVTLRSLMRGKIHFHKNTRFEEIDYALVRLGRFPTKDDLWAWVEDVRKEFEVSE
jgi:hypothetical protein